MGVHYGRWLSHASRHRSFVLCVSRVLFPVQGQFFMMTWQSWCTSTSASRRQCVCLAQYPQWADACLRTPWSMVIFFLEAHKSLWISSLCTTMSSSIPMLTRLIRTGSARRSARRVTHMPSLHFQPAHVIASVRCWPWMNCAASWQLSWPTSS